MRITDALSRFEVQLEADGRSQHTIRQYRRHVLALARWAPGERLSGDVEDLGHEHIAAFLASTEARTRPDGSRKKAGSMNALRSSLRVFFRYAHEAGLVGENPARLVRRAITEPPPPRALTRAEEKRLLAELRAAKGWEGKRDAMLFEFLLGTGVRLSSALAVDVEDVDLDEGVVRLRSMKRGREDVVFLNARVQEELGRFLGDKESGPVFTNQAGRRLSGRQVQRRFRALRDDLGLAPEISVHSLRHTFACSLLRRTGDLALVQRALGHRSIASTLTYVRVDDVRLREVIAGRKTITAR